MAIWNSGQITSIYTGASPNDSTGDPIRDAFTKVDENFGNISSYLSGGSGSGGLVSFLYANSETFSANVGTFTNLSSSNLLITNATITGNVVADVVIANTGLYSFGNLYTGNILPSSGGMYNLGSSSHPFANIYVQNTISTTQINQSSDASMLLIHANSAGNMDVGILGNVTDYDIDSGYTGNIEFSFFGYQLESDAFVYKIIPTNPMLGNGIAYGGIYGNTHFGSQLLSDTTPSTTANTGALIVAGGAGICGNLNVGGNIFTAGGHQVLSTNMPGINTYPGSTVFAGDVTLVSTTQSTSPTTGALILSYGGVGAAGNINAGGNVVSTSGIVGPYYGTIQTAAQPNITSLGTITSLSAGYIGATTVGVTNLTVSSTLSMAGASLNGLSTLTVGSLAVTANTNSGNVIASGFYFANGTPFTSSTYGNTQVAAYLPTNPTIYTIQANIGAFEITTNANIGGHQLAIASINANIGSIFNNLNTLSANIGAFEITTNANIGGHQLAIASINANIGAFEITTNANIGGHQLAIASINANIGAFEITTNANLGTATTNITTLFSTTATQQTQIGSLYTNANANTAAYLAASTISVGGNINLTGTIVPTSNISSSLGDSTHWFGQIYGTAVHAQYADLAECYEADAAYEPGTVVVFGGNVEITVTSQFADVRVAGAVSTDPAYIMNGASGGIPVALRGKVPVKFVGPVNKGDLLVTCGTRPGYAVSVGTVNTYGQAVFAKSLTTDLTDGEKIITAVII